MNENEVRGSLNDDVTSLDNNQKQQFTDMSYLATNDVEQKKGKVRKTRIRVPGKNGIEFELVATNTNIEKKSYPTAEDKLNLLGLSNEINTNLLNKIKNGEINSNHISDLQKLTLLKDLIKLNTDDQSTAIKNIIENRDNKNLINEEEISSRIIKNGYEDEFTLDTWYKGMIRLINKLSFHSNVSADVMKCLSNDQQLNLKTQISNLIYILDRFVK